MWANSTVSEYSGKGGRESCLSIVGEEVADGVEVPGEERVPTEENGDGGIVSEVGELVEPVVVDLIKQTKIASEALIGSELKLVVGEEDAAVDEGGIGPGGEVGEKGFQPNAIDVVGEEGEDFAAHGATTADHAAFFAEDAKPTLADLVEVVPDMGAEAAGDEDALAGSGEVMMDSLEGGGVKGMLLEEVAQVGFGVGMVAEGDEVSGGIDVEAGDGTGRFRYSLQIVFIGQNPAEHVVTGEAFGVVEQTVGGCNACPIGAVDVVGDNGVVTVVEGSGEAGEGGAIK